MSLLLTVTVGLSGSVVFSILQLPIPWLLGSMFACGVAARFGLPLTPVSNLLERWMRVAIGVSLGPAVASSIAINSTDLPFAISSAVFVTLLTALGGMQWFRYQTRLSRSSAFLSALPGGLSVFLAMADERGDRTQILLAHTVRVVIVVVFISLLARALGVTSPSDVVPQSHFDAIVASLQWRGSANPVVLALLLIACFVIAERIKIAGSHVIIPMFITAALAGLSPLSVESPVIVQSVAMLVFGIVLGLQIGATKGREHLHLVTAATLFSAFAILLVAIIALILSQIIPQGFLVLFLALAPGGIAEVSLVALALGLDAGLVALVHSCRFVFIVVIGPLAFRFLRDED